MSLRQQGAERKQCSRVPCGTVLPCHQRATQPPTLGDREARMASAVCSAMDE